MDKRYVVIGGWGLLPEVLKPVFGNSAVYIDSNVILPQLMQNGTLRPDWTSITAKYLEPYVSRTTTLAGWSTGAMLAYGAASHLEPQNLTLISATLSFCRTPELRFGMRRSILDSMINRVQKEPYAVLTEFAGACGFTESPVSEPLPWSGSTLADGLTFLANANLSTLTVPSCKTVFFHGLSDRIIPFAAGEYISKHCNAHLTQISGPHACFINDNNITKTINEGLDNEPV